MTMPKIKIDQAMYDRLSELSDKAGYSSVDEFVTHLIERELAKFQDANDDQQIEERLRGLGYIE
jgi:metal-responsive CopG/Arc/MetJ family transcriptional regulator